MINYVKKHLSRFFVSKKGICFICDQVFSEKELIIANEMSFCQSDHLRFKNEKWIIADTRESDPLHPENALYLSELKLALAKHNIPSFIRAEYKEKDSGIMTELNLSIPEQFILQFKELAQKISS